MSSARRPADGRSSPSSSSPTDAGTTSDSTAGAHRSVRPVFFPEAGAGSANSGSGSNQLQPSAISDRIRARWHMAPTGACLWAERLRVTWRPGAPAFRSGLWGRASRLPISLVAGGVACPRDSGKSSQAGDDPRGVASRGTGLLIRRDAFASRRPSVAPSARSREGDGRGLRPRRWRAGGLPRGVERCTGAVVRGGC